MGSITISPSGKKVEVEGGGGEEGTIVFINRLPIGLQEARNSPNAGMPPLTNKRRTSLLERV